MYPGSLADFYHRYNDLENLSYDEHYNLLLNDTTEFCGSYARTFKKLGIEVDVIVANDEILQKKWLMENKTSLTSIRNILTKQIEKIKPEVLFIEDLSFADTELITTIKDLVKSIKLVFASHCSPLSPRIIERLKHVDFSITCTPGIKNNLENYKIHPYLVYHGFDTEILKRITPDDNSKKHDFVFSGSLTSGAGFHGKRIELIESILRANINLDLYVNLESKYKIRTKQVIFSLNEILKKVKLGNAQKYLPILRYGESRINYYSDLLLNNRYSPVYGMDMFKIFNNSRIILNYHIGATGNFGGNMRMFEVTGIGSCLLTDNKDNLNDLFLVDNEIVTYVDENDCIEKVKWLLSHEKERKEIADKGQKRTLNFHTVENRCKELINIIEKDYSFI